MASGNLIQITPLHAEPSEVVEANEDLTLLTLILFLLDMFNFCLFKILNLEVVRERLGNREFATGNGESPQRTKQIIERPRLWVSLMCFLLS